MKTATRVQVAEDRNQRSEVRGQRSGWSSTSSIRNGARAFSLIELLVVIGVIVLLAGLTLPVMQGVSAAQAKHRARVELGAIETAIMNYKTKLGYYPPDNPLNPADWYINQLYYELLGTTETVGPTGQPVSYQTLDGSASLAVGNFQAAFYSGTGVTGFMNCSKAGADDNVAKAVKFLERLRPDRFLEVKSLPQCTVLGVSMAGSPVFTGRVNGEIVPYGYNMSSPQHNPGSFDLWVDIIVGGKTNRISNWSAKPIIVYYNTLANAYP